MSNKNLICQSTALKTFRLTKTILDSIYPDPVLKTNPHYNNAAPMRLYDEAKLKAIISSPEVRARIEKHMKRSQSSKAGATKAQETKMKRMRIKLDKAIADIRVEKIDPEEVRKDAIDSYNEYQELVHYGDEHEWHPAHEGSNKAFRDRITVNYIRHNMTEYDNELFETNGMVGKTDFYKEYRNAVLDAIGKAYPKLLNECKRQKNQTKGRS